MSILLDTTVIIDLLRKNRSAIDFVAALPRRPFVSPPNIMELHAGFRSRQELDLAKAVMAQFAEARLNDNMIWQRAGEFVKHYQPSHGLDDLDALIAATAEHHNLNLATRNVKHFPMFKRLKAAY